MKSSENRVDSLPHSGQLKRTHELYDLLVEEKRKRMRLEEQLEAADRVLVVADQLAEWCRVATSVKGVFSNNLGAQAQGQGMANLVVRYIATRESYPATSDPFTGEPGPEDVSMYVEPDPATKREE